MQIEVWLNSIYAVLALAIHGSKTPELRSSYQEWRAMKSNGTSIVGRIGVR